ncbi:MAG: FecR domain-containing protein [Bacteroidetes bacterium]|nr:FecR domain-containing protein [Bacteroidota bacterium]NWJ53304.1 FecR domain-containing protein [Bacteroidota bacterium]
MKNDIMNNLEQEEALRLIAKYLGDNATAEEIAELEAWIKDSSSNWDYFMKVKNIWHSMDKSIDPSDISTTDALDDVMNQISRKSTMIRFWRYFQTAAAILIIPLILGGLFWQKFNSTAKEKEHIAYKEVFTSNGTRLAFNLEDGTKVWLNAGSSLKYPEKFTSNQRSVLLKGEAYFEVESDKSKPFVVYTKSLAVKATGTKFNVRAFLDQKQTEVSLLSGKVAVSKAGTTDNTIISNLKPYQHLDYDITTQQSEIVEGDLYKYIAWRDGKLLFRNDPLSDVLNRIGEFHNIHFQCTDKKLLEYRYHITFQNESLSEILEILKASSPMDFKMMKRNADLPDGTIPRQEILIFPKRK